ncbi:MAG: kelch repeat-containing protein [Bacteroidales bacterium]
MKNKLLFLLLNTFCTVLFFNSCEKDEDTELIGDWAKASDFEGIPRTDAVGFTIGDKAYLGTGYDGDERLNDFWEYDPERDFWQQKADLPGSGRNGAVGFGTESKGYIGTGYDGSEKLDDFWEYDPTSNAWLKKADFEGGARYGSVGFAIEGIGYIGTGYDGNTLKDFWKYNPETDEWTQIVSIGGSKRRDATAFVIDNKAYVFTGVNNGSYVSDFWCYDPSAETWTEKREIENASDDDYDDEYDITGINAVGFSIGLMGYVATGGQGSVGNSVWEYDPLTDLWQKKTNFEGSARTEAVAFTVNNRGFIATGRNSSYYFDDIWEFKPNDTYSKNY